MIPIIPIITAAISAFGDKKIKGFNQTVGQLVTSKTNNLSAGLITYAITILSSNPDNIDRAIGNAIIIYAAYQVFKRDTKFKTPE